MSDKEWIVRALLATMFAVLMGTLLTFAYGYLVIKLLMSAFFGATN